ncbi:MAG: acyltransferase [Erysipelotrichaceae bacterium]|nr:acyltransferase [Erysipelotrichaceae bacterium]
MKLVMAFFVMVVHFSPFKTIHPVLHFISIHGFTRIAVPFFFLSSGYLLSEQGKIPSQRLIKTLTKLIKLYLFWTFIYFPLIVLQLMNTPSSLHWSIILTRNLFFEGSFIHLWYFIASIIGLVIVTTLQRFLKTRFVFTLLILLFMLGVLGDSYYGFSMTIPYLNTFKTTLFQFINTTRNGVFFAPLFIFTGILIKQFQPNIKKQTLLLSLLFILTLSFIEIFFLRSQGWAKDYNLTFLIYPLSLISFLISLRVKVNFNTDRYRSMATTLFYIHIYAYVIIQAVLYQGDITLFRNYGLIDFSLAFLLSLVLTLFIHRYKHVRLVRELMM